MSDDDICGAECADGTPCQNAAGSCGVASHSDPDAENAQGRDFSLGESDHDDILEAAAIGASKRGCARAAGVSHTELERYLEAHDGFRASFERARARGEAELIEGGLRDEDVDSSFAKFLLASSFDYKKTEKKEVTGDGGGAVEVTFNEEIVGTPWEADEDTA